MDSSGRGARDGRAVYEGPQAPEAFHRRVQEADSRPLQRRKAQARDHGRVRPRQEHRGEVDQVDKRDRDYRNILTDTDLQYRKATAMLLLGTAAQESNFVWERQRTPTWDGDVGGFSKWQVEKASISHTLFDLTSRTNLRDRYDRITQFLFADPKATNNWAHLPLETFLWMLRLNDNDYLGVMFAREHYRRRPEPIPYAVEDQAAYWKEFYNTSAGAGTVEEYVHNWQRYCEEVVNEPN